MSDKKRYAVTVDFYIWAVSDQEAIKASEIKAGIQDATTGDACRVVAVHDASSTFIKPRKIK